MFQFWINVFPCPNPTQSIAVLSHDIPFSNEDQGCRKKRVEPQLRERAAPRDHGDATWLIRVDGDRKNIADDFDFD